MKKYKIGFIGFGNMASAIIKSILKNNIYTPKKITVFDIKKEKINKAKKIKLNISENIQGVVKNSEIVVFSVKPQDIKRVLKEIEPQNNLFISICAGITTKFIKKHLGNVPVIRVMPNTPMLVGEGVTGAYVSCNKKYKKIADKIFSSGSRVFWFEKETMLDSITALTGSGPAYVFYFIESLIDAGKKIGIKKGTTDIVIKLIKGSLKLLEDTKKKPAVLRKMVTSKKGTTEKAIKTLEKYRFKNIIFESVKNAKKRAKDLSK